MLCEQCKVFGSCSYCEVLFCAENQKTKVHKQCFHCGCIEADTGDCRREKAKNKRRLEAKIFCFQPCLNK